MYVISPRCSAFPSPTIPPPLLPLHANTTGLLGIHSRDFKLTSLCSAIAAVDHTPRPHPASPSQSLPSDFSANSFSEYRQRSQQYGPLQKTWARTSEGGIGGASGNALPSIEAGKGLFFDRDELPARFRRNTWTVEEIEAIESGGASAFA